MSAKSRTWRYVLNAAVYMIMFITDGCQFGDFHRTILKKIYIESDIKHR